MRKSLVAVLAAALVGIPAVPAFATIDHCPAGVADVRGDQPTSTQIQAMFQAAATKHGVPVSLLKVIAYKESTWRQFTGAVDAPVLVSNDGVCSLGIMQVTADDRDDAVQLAEDPAYNVDVGAAILKEKWLLSQQTPPPTGYAADDPDVVENWFYALCLYNGCDGSSDAYAAHAANLLHDPFRWLPADWRELLRPVGFTKPADADPAYVFPSAFQARTTETGGEFVFYDHTTGVVSKTVAAKVHRFSQQPVIQYPPFTIGPDALPSYQTTCVVCSGWRVAEGTGLAGRAHWTNSVTGAVDQTLVRWPWIAINEPGRYRVDVYVPALGSETLGVATYRMKEYDGTVVRTVTVDQEARKGGWVSLGVVRWTSFAPVLEVGDRSTVAGRKIVADGARVTPVPVLTMTAAAPRTIDYRRNKYLEISLVDAFDNPMVGRGVQVHRRIPGTSAWQGVGTWTTNQYGTINIETVPYRNYEYTARFTPRPGERMLTAASGNVRIDVRPEIAALLTRNTILSGEYTTIRTSVAPSHAGHAVQIQRYYSGAWRSVAYVRLDSYSQAGWTFRMMNNGACADPYQLHRFRVYKPADYDHAAAASAPVDLVVHPRC